MEAQRRAMQPLRRTAAALEDRRHRALPAEYRAARGRIVEDMDVINRQLASEGYAPIR